MTKQNPKKSAPKKTVAKAKSKAAAGRGGAIPSPNDRIGPGGSANDPVGPGR